MPNTIIHTYILCPQNWKSVSENLALEVSRIHHSRLEAAVERVSMRDCYIKALCKKSSWIGHSVLGRK